MNVVWTELSLDDLSEINAWIAQEQPSTALLVSLRILDSVESVADHPLLGRTGRVAGTREFAVPKTPFVVFYSVEGDTLRVLRVLRGRRATLPER